MLQPGGSLSFPSDGFVVTWEASLLLVAADSTTFPPKIEEGLALRLQKKTAAAIPPTRTNAPTPIPADSPAPRGATAPPAAMPDEVDEQVWPAHGDCAVPQPHATAASLLGEGDAAAAPVALLSEGEAAPLELLP